MLDITRQLPQRHQSQGTIQPRKIRNPVRSLIAAVPNHVNNRRNHELNEKPINQSNPPVRARRFSFTVGDTYAPPRFHFKREERSRPSLETLESTSKLNVEPDDGEQDSVDTKSLTNDSDIQSIQSENIFASRRNPLNLGALFVRPNRPNKALFARRGKSSGMDINKKTADDSTSNNIENVDQKLVPQLELNKSNDLEKDNDALKEECRLVKCELEEHKVNSSVLKKECEDVKSHLAEQVERNSTYEKELAYLRHELAQQRALEAKKDRLIEELVEENLQIKKWQCTLEEWRMNRISNLQEEIEISTYKYK